MKINHDRPKHDEEHLGLTWRDMPDQSTDGVVSKKITFALFRMGATNDEENEFIEAKRKRLGK